MTLKTKIICISSIVILLTLFATNLIIHIICSDIMKKEAINSAYAESKEIKNSFDTFIFRIQGAVEKTEVEYFFKTNRDNYTVCVCRGEEFYNSTVLTLSDIASRSYCDDLDLMYCEQTVAGRHILIFKMSASAETELYHIVDVTLVYDKMHMLALVMLGISAAVIVLSVALLYMIVGRTLVPLSELSKGAKRIADGAYDKRVIVKTQDEIGALAVDFNTMATAVEVHTRELEESERRKSLFMGSLTHELKTPLTAISGYAQTLRAVALSDEDREEALTYIYEEAGRLDRLAKKMMRIMELDWDTELVFEEIPVKKLFASAVRTCTVAAAQKDVTLNIGNSEGIIYCDFDLMCDVMVNLIDNAIKASFKGGMIQISSDNGCIMVEDFGCGIPQDEIKRITEPFYMVDKSRSRKNGGAGLGLALTKLILNRHDMKMDIESEVGKGTKISVYKSFATR